MRLDFLCDFFLLVLGLLVLGLAAFVVVFEVMLGCPFGDSRAAGRGRGCGEAGDRSICPNRLAPADFRSVASLAPFRGTPILHRWTLLNGTKLSGSVIGGLRSFTVN